jgi:hypothetical protein
MYLNAIKVSVIYVEPLMDDPCFRLLEAQTVTWNQRFISTT